MGRETEMNDRQDTMQRIQVGVIGLVAVLLLVSVANFVLQRASDERTAIEEIQAESIDATRELAAEPEPAPAEPLAELGITPAPAPEEIEEAPVPVAPDARGQVVPDLKPDPKLEAPMDQEQ
jgi:cytoskeletal protein RodZ